MRHIGSRFLERPTQTVEAVPSGNANPMRLPMFGFLGAIALGTVLLSLPISQAKHFPIVDAFFVSTSAVCVTGLSTIEIGTMLTPFGQGVLLALIQFGGLGIMVFSTSLLIVAGMRPRFSHISAVRDTFTPESSLSPGRILAEVVRVTFIIEAVGTLILFTQFDDLGLKPLDRLYFSFFHAVSAFCNAGFGLLPDSMTFFRDNPIVNLTLSGLIISGGLGFLVIGELLGNNPYRPGLWTRLSLHARLVLTTSAILLVSGTLLFLLGEWNNTLADKSWTQKLLASFFHSVSARTAGFNTIEVSTLAPQTLFLLMLLMFIGASPGSCGGGIKVTTASVLATLGFSRFFGHDKTQVFKRTIPDEQVERSTRLFVLAIVLVVLGTSALMVTELGGAGVRQAQGKFLELLFETVSAFGTVGLSMGITPGLSEAGKLVLCVIMFVGRLGPLALATVVSKKNRETAWYAEENVMIG